MKACKAQGLRIVSTRLKTCPQPASSLDATCFHTQLELVCALHRARPRGPEDSRYPLGSGLGFLKASGIFTSCPLQRGLSPSISSPAFSSTSSAPKPSCCCELHVVTNELPKAPTSCSSLSPAGETQRTWS